MGKSYSLFMSSVAMLFLLMEPAVFAGELVGAGRRIPAPIFESWADSYAATKGGETFKYRAVSAAEGLTSIMDGSADYGETDSPLSKADLDAKDLWQFPYMYTAITPVVNLPGITFPIQLTGPLVADIFMGNITKWDDPRIKQINVGVHLPNASIKLVHLVGNRGTTYSFTSYLSKVSPEWAQKIGKSKSPKWPLGEEVENLYKMGDYIKATPYSMGVSENAYARKNNLMGVKLKNSFGKYISAHPGSIAGAVKDAKWDVNNGLQNSFIDMPGPDSWPITEVSYILIKRNIQNAAKKELLHKYLSFGLTRGYFDVINLNFNPIELSIYKIVRTSIFMERPYERTAFLN